MSDSSIQAAIPKRVSVGQELVVTFSHDGQVMQDRWRIVRISTKGELCRLHSAREGEVGNTVYVKPCRVIK